MRGGVVLAVVKGSSEVQTDAFMSFLSPDRRQQRWDRSGAVLSLGYWCSHERRANGSGKCATASNKKVRQGKKLPFILVDVFGGSSDYERIRRRRRRNAARSETR